MRGVRMTDARTALAHFLDSLLAVDDEASLLGFNHETRMFGQWTTERAGMRVKLDAIRPSGGTALYDAIDAALPLFESRQHPRAAILLVSDGADTASDMTPTALKQKLVRSDVFLYAIGIDSLDARNSTRINPFTLNELTGQGGGYTEIIRSTAELGPATERIAEELNQPVPDWLHADDARRRQIPQRPGPRHQRIRPRPPRVSVAPHGSAQASNAGGRSLDSRTFNTLARAVPGTSLRACRSPARTSG